jgi:hypothetical protein
MRDLQRCCSNCDSKQLCAHELEDKPKGASWPKYCPNEQTIAALTTKPMSPKQPQRAALLLLAKGYSPVQIASVAGVSRQLVERWGMSAGVDWRRAHDVNLSNAWRRALKGKRASTAERAAKARLVPEKRTASVFLARAAAFNIMRHPYPHPHFHQRRPGTLRGKDRTTRAVQSSI